MSESLTKDRCLGPRVISELQALKVMRAQVIEQIAAIDRKEAMILALVAEAQGYVATPATRYDYDLDAGTWRPLEADG